MLDRLADHVLKVADAGVPFGVQLAIEVNWCSLCRSFRTAAELVRRTAHPSVGVTWDPAHFHSTPSRLGDLDLLQGKILHAHLDDMNGTFVEVVNINADRVIPGEGILPMREWTNKVTACGYQGYHCLELFSEALWKEDLETICRKGMRGCLQVWPDATF
jgi:sugar phosphate isomerase/epimerase